MAPRVGNAACLCFFFMIIPLLVYFVQDGTATGVKPSGRGSRAGCNPRQLLANLDCPCNAEGLPCRKGTNSYCIRGLCDCRRPTWRDHLTGAFCRDPFHIPAAPTSLTLCGESGTRVSFSAISPGSVIWFTDAKDPVTCTPSSSRPYTQNGVELFVTVSPGSTYANISARYAPGKTAIDSPTVTSAMTITCTDSRGVVAVRSVSVTTKAGYCAGGFFITPQAAATIRVYNSGGQLTSAPALPYIITFNLYDGVVTCTPLPTTVTRAGVTFSLSTNAASASVTAEGNPTATDTTGTMSVTCTDGRQIKSNTVTLNFEVIGDFTTAASSTSVSACTNPTTKAIDTTPAALPAITYTNAIGTVTCTGSVSLTDAVLAVATTGAGTTSSTLGISLATGKNYIETTQGPSPASIVCTDSVGRAAAAVTVNFQTTGFCSAPTATPTSTAATICGDPSVTGGAIAITPRTFTINTANFYNTPTCVAANGITVGGVAITFSVTGTTLTISTTTRTATGVPTVAAAAPKVVATCSTTTPAQTADVTLNIDATVSATCAFGISSSAAATITSFNSAGVLTHNPTLPYTLTYNNAQGTVTCTPTTPVVVGGVTYTLTAGATSATVTATGPITTTTEVTGTMTVACTDGTGTTSNSVALTFIVKPDFTVTLSTTTVTACTDPSIKTITLTPASPALTFANSNGAPTCVGTPSPVTLNGVDLTIGTPTATSAPLQIAYSGANTFVTGTTAASPATEMSIVCTDSEPRQSIAVKVQLGTSGLCSPATATVAPTSLTACGDSTATSGGIALSATSFTITPTNFFNSPTCTAAADVTVGGVTLRFAVNTLTVTLSTTTKSGAGVPTVVTGSSVRIATCSTTSPTQSVDVMLTVNVQDSQTCSGLFFITPTAATTITSYNDGGVRVNTPDLPYVLSFNNAQGAVTCTPTTAVSVGGLSYALTVDATSTSVDTTGTITTTTQATGTMTVTCTDANGAVSNAVTLTLIVRPDFTAVATSKITACTNPATKAITLTPTSPLVTFTNNIGTPTCVGTPSPRTLDGVDLTIGTPRATSAPLQVAYSGTNTFVSGTTAASTASQMLIVCTDTDGRKAVATTVQLETAFICPAATATVAPTSLAVCGDSTATSGGIGLSPTSFTITPDNFFSTPTCTAAADATVGGVTLKFTVAGTVVTVSTITRSGTNVPTAVTGGSVKIATCATTTPAQSVDVVLTVNVQNSPTCAGLFYISPTAAAAITSYNDGGVRVDTPTPPYVLTFNNPQGTVTCTPTTAVSVGGLSYALTVGTSSASVATTGTITTTTVATGTMTVTCTDGSGAVSNTVTLTLTVRPDFTAVASTAIIKACTNPTTKQITLDPTSASVAFTNNLGTPTCVGTPSPRTLDGVDLTIGTPTATSAPLQVAYSGTNTFVSGTTAASTATQMSIVCTDTDGRRAVATTVQLETAFICPPASATVNPTSLTACGDSTATSGGIALSATSFTITPSNFFNAPTCTAATDATIGGVILRFAVNTLTVTVSTTTRSGAGVPTVVTGSSVRIATCSTTSPTQSVDVMLTVNVQDSQTCPGLFYITPSTARTINSANDGGVRVDSPTLPYVLSFNNAQGTVTCTPTTAVSVGGLSYALTFDGTSASVATTGTITTTTQATGTMTVTCTDGNGAVSNTVTLTLIVHPDFIATATAKITACTNPTTKQITLTPTSPVVTFTNNDGTPTCVGTPTSVNLDGVTLTIGTPTMASAPLQVAYSGTNAFVSGTTAASTATQISIVCTDIDSQRAVATTVQLETAFICPAATATVAPTTLAICGDSTATSGGIVLSPRTFNIAPANFFSTPTCTVAPAATVGGVSLTFSITGLAVTVSTTTRSGTGVPTAVTGGSVRIATCASTSPTQSVDVFLTINVQDSTSCPGLFYLTPRSYATITSYMLVGGTGPFTCTGTPANPLNIGGVTYTLNTATGAVTATGTVTTTTAVTGSMTISCTDSSSPVQTSNTLTLNFRVVPDFSVTAPVNVITACTNPTTRQIETTPTPLSVTFNNPVGTVTCVGSPTSIVENNAVVTVDSTPQTTSAAINVQYATGATFLSDNGGAAQSMDITCTDSVSRTDTERIRFRIASFQGTGFCSALPAASVPTVPATQTIRVCGRSTSTGGPIVIVPSTVTIAPTGFYTTPPICTAAAQTPVGKVMLNFSLSGSVVTITTTTTTVSGAANVRVPVAATQTVTIATCSTTAPAQTASATVTVTVLDIQTNQC